MIVILGGGPAGRLASIRLASAGKEVCLIERGGLDGIGGQCLHSGCMPVCAMNDVARQVHNTRELHNLGILDSVPRVDFCSMLRQMGAVQAKIAAILDTETREAGVDIIYGKSGRLEGGRVFLETENIAADAVIASTGSYPNIPAIEGIGLQGVYNPRTLPCMERLPEKMVIVGGSVVAAEFAYIFSTFGCEVTILSRSTFLKDIDPHIRALAIKELPGVTIRENAPVLSIGGTRPGQIYPHPGLRDRSRCSLPGSGNCPELRHAGGGQERAPWRGGR